MLLYFYYVSIKDETVFFCDNAMSLWFPTSQKACKEIKETFYLQKNYFLSHWY